MSDEENEDTDGRMIAWPLERLARVMRSREHEEGLNPAQWEALRFLSRANRFSNSPVALTRYLGATKGTISQTLIALERKGFLTRSQRTGGRKSLSLSLTPKGREVLLRDPWAGLAMAADNLGGKTRRRMQRGLDELLAEELRRGRLASFGVCISCRYFRQGGRMADARGPHLCMLFEDALSNEDAQHICIEHVAAD